MKIFSSFVTSKVKSHHPVIQGSSLNNSVCCFSPHIQWIIINIRNNAHQDVVHFLSFLCLNNCSSSEQSESLELEEKGQEWARVKQWNVGRVSEAEWKKSSVRPSQRWQLICCVLLFFSLSLFFSSSFSISSFFCSSESESERKRYSPLSETAELVQPGHLTGPKISLCCCECQSKRSARQGLPWVTLHRLVCACEMDNSLGGLSGRMTRFPGICVVVPWPGSPSKELYYGAVLPLYCYRYHRYGSTGG